MSISPCPVCHEEVSLPDNASPSATVQCPLCQEKYELSRILDRMPPALLVISDNGSSHAHSDSSFGFAGASDRGGGFSFGGSESAQTSAPAFQFEESAAPSASASAPSPASRAPQPRRQKKQKSPMWEIFKVVGGGVVGIGGALLIMWWGLDRDPLDFGPSVYKVLPWVVPAKFSGVASNDDAAAKAKDVADKGPDDNIDTSAKKLGTELDSSVVPWGKNGNDNSNTTTDNNDNSNTNSTTTSNDNSTIALEPVGIRNRPYVAASDMISAMDDYKIAAGNWIKALASTDAEEKRQANATFFATLARFGETVTFADDTDPEVQDLTKTMLTYLGSLKTRDSEYGSLKFIANSASDWLAKPTQRTNGGVMLAGTVIRVESHGRIFESQIQLANATKERVTVYHLKKPADDYVRMAQVLVLGVVVEKPSENLIGYEGGGLEVVCCARAIVHGMADSLDDSSPDSTSDSTPGSPGIPDVPDVPVPSVDVPSIKIPSIDFPSSAVPSIDTPSKKPATDSPDGTTDGANSSQDDN